jgi:hypothetical protein
MGEHWDVRNDLHLGALQEHLQQRPLPYRIQFKKLTRSISQNALLHMWIREIVKHFIRNGKETWSTGAPIDEESMKENLKETFLGTETTEQVNLKTGEVTTKTTTRHSSKLDKGEFYAFMTMIDEWATGHRIRLTRPEDSEYMNLRREMGEVV